jgi:hypothetical protein
MNRRISLLLCVLALLTPMTLLAQDQGVEQAGPALPDPNQPVAEDVYQYIPADCMGFFVVNNLASTLNDSYEFTKEIGLGDMVAPAAPEGFLPLIAQAIGLKEGYNPNGSVAVVMMNPEKTEWNMFPQQNAAPTPPPLVILAAGKSAEEAFALAVKQEDGTVVVATPDNQMNQVKQVGDYIAMSPNAKALELVGKETSTLADKHRTVLKGGHLGIFYNFQVVAPFIQKMMADMEENRMGAMMAMNPVFGMQKMQMEQMNQMDAMSVNMKIAEQGVMMHGLVAYKADSPYAKAMQAVQPAELPLLGRVPNMPYVFATGFTGYDQIDPELMKTNMDMMIQMLETIMSNEGMQLPEDLKTRMQTTSTDLFGQLKSAQIVGGGTGENAPGVAAATAVLGVKDAAKATELLSTESDLLTELIQKTFAETEEDLQGLKFVYTKQAGTIGAVGYDAIEIQHPDVADTTEEEKAEAKKVFGMETPQILVAQADPMTIVMTIGGGPEYLEASVSAAQKGGTIMADPGVLKAMEVMPKERLGMFVFSPKNLIDTIHVGAAKLEEQSDTPPFVAFESDVPVTMVSGKQGADATVTMLLPKAMIQESIAIFMQMMAPLAPAGGNGAAPQGGGGNGEF